LFDCEGYADCGRIDGIKGKFAEGTNEAGLTDLAAANNDELERDDFRSGIHFEKGRFKKWRV
jgi:hypothetical protein